MENSEKKVKLVVEVRQRETEDDPSITIFNLEVSDKGIWRETFGSLELLNAALKGLQIGFSMTSFSLTAFNYSPWPAHSEPSGRRWTLYEDRIMKIDDLDKNGDIIEHDR